MAQCELRVIGPGHDPAKLWTVQEFLDSPLLTSGMTQENPVWVDIQSSDPATVVQLGQAALMHPLSIEDCLNPDGREKAEAYDRYLFVVLAEARWKEGTNWLLNVNVCIAIFADVVFSFHHSPVHCVPFVISQILSQVGGPRPPSPSWVMYALVDHILDMHFVLVNQVVLEVHTLEQIVLILGESEQDDVLLRLAHARRRMAGMVGMLLPKRAILHALTKKGDGTALVGPNVRLYLRDVQDHAVRMLEKLKISNAHLESVNQTYLAKVSIAVGEASNEVNSVMRVFAAVATLFLPLSFMTGLWGMNVTVPGHDDPTMRSFELLCGAMFAVATMTLLFFVWKRWL
eukprot:m51a1_g2374 hypothetical protein (344) ;mRNA; f:670072-671216